MRVYSFYPRRKGTYIYTCAGVEWVYRGIYTCAGVEWVYRGVESR